jgi:hypothetical protein
MRYSRHVEMAEIEKNDFNLNISRCTSTAVGKAEIETSIAGANTALLTHRFDPERINIPVSRSAFCRRRLYSMRRRLAYTSAPSG